MRDDVLDQDFTWLEYQEILRCLKIKSAPGLDGVSYQEIKNLPRSVHGKLLETFNQIMSEGEFPPEWKEFAVVMIEKPGGKATNQ